MELLKIVQEDIPLTERPFSYIAFRLGTSEGEVIKQLQKLKDEKIIRQISPIYDTKKAGYDSALIAFKVEPSRLEEVANFVSACPGVSHNYEREDEFNLWFTLAVPPDATLTLEDAVELIALRTGVKKYAVLRTKRTFKIGVRLDFSSVFEREKEIPQPKEEKNEGVFLTDFEKAVIRETQEDLPLVERPFLEVGKNLGASEKEVLETLRALKEKGVMRRFSAILYHRRAGFGANGMSVWAVPPDRVEEAGKYLAGFRAVSHCYERTTNEHWKYNLFAMIHAKKREEVTELCKRVSEELSLPDYKVLFSRREFKKKRVKLFSEDFYRWERELLSFPLSL
ncbi:MAG: Lrp/AsnC family transcriptional regulator [Aquificae bacterium]|nr:Lrp/AsnC family transcriptional regulator [Aquificota bacterium]